MIRSLFLFSILFAPLQPAITLAEADDGGQLYDRLKRASVEILVERRLAGTGCVIQDDGLILTAAHLFRQSRNEIEVLMADRVRLPATLIAVDEGHDLALLELPKRETPIPHIPLAEQMAAPGKHAFLFGTPLFRHAVMIRGVVARKGTTCEFVDGHYVEVMHVGAIAPKGTSGGPWVNGRGEVIGVQSSGMALGDAQQGIAFVAPLPAVRKLVESKKSAKTPTLGIAVEELWEQPPQYLKKIDRQVTGVVAKIVKKDGQAAKTGIVKNEIISAVDGRPVQFRDDFVQAVRRRSVGNSVKLTVLDAEGKKRREVSIPLVALERSGQ